MSRASEPSKISERDRLAWETCKARLEVEIGLFWNRGIFFWTFLAALLVAYFSNNADVLVKSGTLLVAFMVAYLWTLAMRGSRKWQIHWEALLRTLEPSVTGVLYFAEVDFEKTDSHSIIKAGKYSVSKIAILIGYIFSVALLLALFRDAIVDYRATGICGAKVVFFAAAVVVTPVLHVLAKSSEEGRRDT